MIEQLRREHDTMRGTVASIETHLASSTPPRDPEFARARWRLARELATHLAVERRAYPQIREKLRGQALYDGIDRALDDDFTRHMGQWTATRIEHEWSGFRNEARMLLWRVKRRMTYEETAVFPTLASAA